MRLAVNLLQAGDMHVAHCRHEAAGFLVLSELPIIEDRQVDGNPAKVVSALRKGAFAPSKAVRRPLRNQAKLGPQNDMRRRLKRAASFANEIGVNVALEAVGDTVTHVVDTIRSRRVAQHERNDGYQLVFKQALDIAKE